MKGARLQGDEGRDVFEIALDLTEGHWFRMVLERRLSEATSDDLSVTHQHAAHGRIRQAGRERPLALGDGGAHELLCGRRVELRRARHDERHGSALVPNSFSSKTTLLPLVVLSFLIMALIGTLVWFHTRPLEWMFITFTSKSR